MGFIWLVQATANSCEISVIFPSLFLKNRFCVQCFTPCHFLLFCSCSGGITSIVPFSHLYVFPLAGVYYLVLSTVWALVQSKCNLTLVLVGFRLSTWFYFSLVEKIWASVISFWISPSLVRAVYIDLVKYRWALGSIFLPCGVICTSVISIVCFASLLSC